MIPYKQKVFREKPYTQCFECIQGSKLKCKKCIGKLVSRILKQKECSQTFHRQSKRDREQRQLALRQRMCKTVSIVRHKKPQFEIKTCFGLWMQKLKEKRQSNYDTAGQTLAQWPRRRANKQMMSKIDKPRFENWQSRLLRKLYRNSSQENIPVSRNIRVR